MSKIKIIDAMLKKVFWTKNYILLESSPDYSDNTMALFNKLVEKKVNDKYKLIWLLNGNIKKKFGKNVVSINRKVGNNPIKYLILAYYLYSSKIIIDSNSYVHKMKKEQIRIHLGHGMPFKNALKYCRQIEDFDYILSLSKTFNKQLEYNYETTSDKIINLGYCRNDDLVKYKQDNLSFEKKYENKKIIVWLPTYRNHRNGDEDISVKSVFKYGLPCIESQEDIISLNNILNRYNMVLMVKLHPAQRREDLSKLNLSNIIIITDQELFGMDITLYQLLAKSCALITDYSSVYYDYLITRKPIGLAISDITEYVEKIGFVYENYYDEIKGHYIYNTKDLIDFINEINKRTRISEKTVNKFHDFPDSNSSERVYQFLKKYL